MLKRLEKLLPRYAWLPYVLVWAAQFSAYFVTKLFPARPFVEVALPLDHKIPLRQAWILVYIGAYVYWVFGYGLIMRIGRGNCRRLLRADLLCKAISAAFFVLMPTTMQRPEAVGGGLLGWLVRFIYLCDTPCNLFPSMHCSVSWLIARELMDVKEYSPYLRWGAVGFSVLVFFSTLFTRQHLILDIFGGVALAELTRLISRWWERRCVPHRKY